MATVKITKTSVEKARKRILSVAAAITNGSSRGLREWGEETILLAKERCPVDTGTLKSTGMSRLVENSGSSSGTSVLELSFGGPAAKYAFIVHEGVRNGRPIHFHYGQAKFLESAIDEKKSVLKEAVMSSIEREMGRK